MQVQTHQDATEQMACIPQEATDEVQSSQRSRKRPQHQQPLPSPHPDNPFAQFAVPLAMCGQQPDSQPSPSSAAPPPRSRGSSNAASGKRPRPRKATTQQSARNFTDLSSALAIPSTTSSMMPMAVAAPIDGGEHPAAGGKRDAPVSDRDKELEDIIESLFSDADELKPKEANNANLAPANFNFASSDISRLEIYSRLGGLPESDAGESSMRGSDSFDGEMPTEMPLGMTDSAELLGGGSQGQIGSSPPSEASSTLSNCRLSTTELLDLGENFLD